jgi:hypothetical protein
LLLGQLSFLLLELLQDLLVLEHESLSLFFLLSLLFGSLLLYVFALSLGHPLLLQLFVLLVFVLLFLIDVMLQVLVCSQKHFSDELVQADVASLNNVFK